MAENTGGSPAFDRRLCEGDTSPRRPEGRRRYAKTPRPFDRGVSQNTLLAELKRS
jgi:hypothetical protein